MSLLRLLFGRRKRTITVTLYGDDAAFDRRRALRDAVVAALAEDDLGVYLGGGTMATASTPHYNIEFSVTQERRALAAIRGVFASLGARSDTEWRVGAAEARRLFTD